jgi:hypothetical protein
VVLVVEAPVQLGLASVVPPASVVVGLVFRKVLVSGLLKICPGQF